MSDNILDKSPGPDGFTIHFHKSCWDIINLCRMLNWTKGKDNIGGATNSYFLYLIPKNHDLLI